MIDTRTQILERNYQAVRLNGFQGMRADKVITELGITKGALYHYFPNKLELGYAIVDEIISPAYREGWRAFEQATENHLAALIACLEAFKHRSNEEEVKLGCPLNNLIQEMTALDGGFKARLQAIVNQMRGSLETGLRNGQAAGSITSTIDPTQTAWFILSCLEGSYGMAKAAQSVRVFEDCVNQLITYLRTLAV
ncbi:MAG: TetR/AcrR family transcriptional regulator [Cytophagaceae bacterium]|nr:TetR/AcrR family transcriptional regulator [Cytophagaceae bacterium]